MAATVVQHKTFSSSVALGDNGEVVVEHTSNGHFATVTINRPEVHNALSPGVMDGLESALNMLEQDKKVWGAGCRRRCCRRCRTSCACQEAAGSCRDQMQVHAPEPIFLFDWKNPTCSTHLLGEK